MTQYQKVDEWEQLSDRQQYIRGAMLDQGGPGFVLGPQSFGSLRSRLATTVTNEEHVAFSDSSSQSQWWLEKYGDPEKLNVRYTNAGGNSKGLIDINVDPISTLDRPKLKLLYCLAFGPDKSASLPFPAMLNFYCSVAMVIGESSARQMCWDATNPDNIANTEDGKCLPFRMLEYLNKKVRPLGRFNTNLHVSGHGNLLDCIAYVVADEDMDYADCYLGGDIPRALGFVPKQLKNHLRFEVILGDICEPLRVG